eukprot:1829741-Amphidinium_carterae.1
MKAELTAKDTPTCSLINGAESSQCVTTQVTQGSERGTVQMEYVDVRFRDTHNGMPCETTFLQRENCSSFFNK